jgi:hypothetical protein
MDTSTCDITLDDSGVAYWWGDMPSNALSVPPGGTITVSAYIFGYMPGAPPDFTPPPGVEGPPGDPTCSDGIDNDDDGLTDEQDPDCIPPPGVEGPPGDPSCSDGIDNDDDGLTDEEDPDCIPPNVPPDCSGAAPSIDELWPPNHKMKTIRVEGVFDPDGDPVTITVTALAQDEPLNGRGDGNTCPDAGGIGGDRVMLRSERSGQRDGRIYHIAFDADDGMGGMCTGVVTVCVPHDKARKKSQCVDQGPIFDATGPCAAAAGEYLTRTQAFYGANPVGSELLSMNEADSLRLNPADPLRAVYADGTLLPLTLGSGRFIFPDLVSIVGSAAKGSKDGGFLPGMGKKRVRQGARNMLPNQALTLALNSGLSLLGADSLTEMDIDGDGTKEALHFLPGFLDLVVDWPGHFGDLMSVERVLIFADTVLANGAASAKVAEDLAGFAEIPVGQPRNAKVGDLIHLLTKINAACKLPAAKCTGFLLAP